MSSDSASPKEYIRKPYGNETKCPGNIPDISVKGNRKQCLILVKFNEHRNLTPDEICTCINYMNNSIGPEKMKELLQTESLDELKTKLQKFGELGF